MPTAKELNKHKENGEAILFVRNAKTNKEKRKIEFEYRKTFKDYKKKEAEFTKELTEAGDQANYIELYHKFNKRWQAMCDYNYSRGLHVYTMPNKFYFQNKYMPKEDEKSNGWFKRLFKAIHNQASKVNYIEG